MDAAIHRGAVIMLFNESSDTKRINQVKRPERNRKEKTSQAHEELCQADVLELMGVHDRGHKRRRGAWRQA